jgi:hypothetical protein
MITICKAVLTRSAPGRIRAQTQGLESDGLRDLAVKLAADPDLMVWVITYADGRQELEVPAPGRPARRRAGRHHPAGRHPAPAG